MFEKEYNPKDDVEPTTSSKRATDEKGGVSWSNYDGQKWKSNGNDTFQYPDPTQFNSKSNGEHKWYEPKTGKMGAAFDERKSNSLY